MQIFKEKRNNEMAIFIKTDWVAIASYKQYYHPFKRRASKKDKGTY